MVRARPGSYRSAPNPSAADGRRSTFGRSFNLAEVAGGAVDDAQERWLIQKDRLDFGPFSLAQIRAQIQRGEIIGEHMIVDSDTGARKKVKDFPPLREFTKSAERTLAHPCVASLLPFEDVQRGASIKGRRQALLDAGAKLTEQSLGVREPKKGLMPL